MIVPTRMELTKTKKKLVTATRGHKLLKNKRDELMRQFLEMINECSTLRQSVEKRLDECNKAFIAARAEMSSQAVNTALCTSKQELQIDAKIKNVMSVNIPELKLISYNNTPSYGTAFTAEALDIAAEKLRSIFPDMLKLAQMEHSCRLMADEIERTRRRVNALEHVTIPTAQSDIRYIEMKLSENERANQIRLMKVKDMMIKERISGA